ncbi:MAG: HAMP domain-containing sensor histidine kinase [Anaerolineales bacterium]|nr:HAMP domain-containing sensor histidine kinase [Anaerolineales bacterium]
MSVLTTLARIRPAFLQRAINRMARGAGVRADFEEQLDQFYDLLIQAVETGDPSWLDSVLYNWAASLTQSDLQEGQKNVSAVLDHMLIHTYEIAREDLEEKEALDLLGAVLPIFTYALDKAARFEMETRVTYISNELADIQQELERLDRNKSNFIAVAAHELRTPLTLIEGYSAMIGEMLKKDENGQIASLLDGVSNGIQRLRSIVDDMIDVSRIDTDLLSLNFQPLRLNQIFSQLKYKINDSLASRRQSLNTRAFSGSNEMIFADSERLNQAFHNILVNAIKYTPDGGRITVDGRMLPGFIEVTITDTGIGISPEYQAVIFDKFGQIGDTARHSSGKTKFKGGGPGLGLPIARGILEAHGGTIWVESKGHDEKRCPGSTFHVLLPIRTEPPDPKIARLFGFEVNQKED